MILDEVLRRIKFKIGSTDDISGRAINPIVNNRNIIDELNSQIRQYANITKGIQDIYSFPLRPNQIYVEAPPLALRSEAYYHLYIIINGTIFPMDMRGPRDVYKNFITNPVQGITNWILPFHEGKQPFFATFPKTATEPRTTTLTSNISETDTEIPVNDAAGFVFNNGRFTIDNEIIKYQRRDATKFYDCQRGVEMSTAKAHSSSTTITENNVIIHYSRLHNPIIIKDNDLIPIEVLTRVIEVADEHMEGIIKATAYNLLIKIDSTRAIPYKLDYTELYEQYKKDISVGYYRGRSGTGITEPSPINERGIAYGATSFS